jgi:hypothetical protein
MSDITESATVHKIRGLLRLAHGAMQIGNEHEAKAASNGAHSTATTAGLQRTYIAYHKTCPYVAERMFEDTACVEYLFSKTPAQEWQRRTESASECGVALAPAEYLIIGCVATGKKTQHGACVLIPDWADTHEAVACGRSALSEGK